MKKFLIFIGVLIAYRAVSFGLSGFFDGEPTDDVFATVGLPPGAIPTGPVERTPASASHLEKTRQAFQATSDAVAYAFYEEACITLGWREKYVTGQELSCGRNSWDRWRGLSLRPCEASAECTHEVLFWATRHSR